MLFQRTLRVRLQGSLLLSTEYHCYFKMGFLSIISFQGREVLHTSAGLKTFKQCF
jgi:hypothetical protein